MFLEKVLSAESVGGWCVWGRGLETWVMLYWQYLNGLRYYVLSSSFWTDELPDVNFLQWLTLLPVGDCFVSR